VVDPARQANRIRAEQLSHLGAELPRLFGRVSLTDADVRLEFLSVATPPEAVGQC
jgi:hypothetical protein